MTRPGEEDRRLASGALPLPNPDQVNEFHRYDDVDNAPESHHHTLGPEPIQAAPGDHNHDGRNSKTISGTSHAHDTLPLSGTGSPEGVISAPVGRLYVRTDGAADQTFYIKESGAGSTGWKAVGSGMKILGNIFSGSGSSSFLSLAQFATTATVTIPATGNIKLTFTNQTNVVLAVRIGTTELFRVVNNGNYSEVIYSAAAGTSVTFNVQNVGAGTTLTAQAHFSLVIEG